MSSERHNLIAYIRQVGAKEATKALKEYEGSIKKTTGSLGAFDIALGVTAGSLATRGIGALVGAAREGLVLSARLDTVSAGFDAFTASVDENIISLKSLRSATKGTVADVDLLTTANNALALGLPVERMNELFESSRIVGNVMGRTTLQAVQDLSTGIGRQSRLILDNLGIIVNTEEAYREFAATLGKTASQLSSTERKTAFAEAAMAALNEKAELLSGSVSETQTNLERWNATVKNTTTFLGSFAGAILNVGAAAYDLSVEFGDQEGVAQDLLLGYNDLTGETIALDVEMHRLIETSQNVGSSFYDTGSIVTTAIDDIDTGIETLTDGMLSYRSMMVSASDAAQQFFEDQATYVTGQKYFPEAEITPIQQQLKGLEDALGDTRSESDLLRLEQLKLTDAFKDGRINEADYERESANLEDRLRGLRTRQAELRIAINQTTDAMKTQTEALDLGELGAPTIPDVPTGPSILQQQLIGLQDSLDDTQDETALLMLDQLKLTDAYKDGRITEEAYKKGMDKLEDRLRGLRILQAELKISIDETTEAMRAQDEAIAAGQISPPPEGTTTFSVPFTSRPDYLAGLAPGTTTSADVTYTIDITLDVDKLTADPTEIQALVQTMAEELYKELQKRGGVP